MKNQKLESIKNYREFSKVYRLKKPSKNNKGWTKFIIVACIKIKTVLINFIKKAKTAAQVQIVLFGSSLGK